jgi:two-component system, OmpR family, phosphate regulon response regulator PhoB
VTADGTAERVLIVDDEADMCRLLAFNLEEAGFAVEAVPTAAGALDAVTRRRPAVVVLDLMLPDMSGNEVCRRIRANPALTDVGILMLTARGDEIDRVVGFEIGADDYVTKPFSVREVVLRVRALARRVADVRAARTRTDSGRRLRWRGLEIDPERQRVFAEGKEIALRPMEYRLIVVLFELPGRVHTRAELADHIWGARPEGELRMVDQQVARLRRALGPYGGAVETVRGFGYRVRDA